MKPENRERESKDGGVWQQWQPSDNVRQMQAGFSQADGGWTVTGAVITDLGSAPIAYECPLQARQHVKAEPASRPSQACDDGVSGCYPHKTIAYVPAADASLGIGRKASLLTRPASLLFLFPSSLHPAIR